MMPFLLVDNAHLAVVIAITAVGDIRISRVIGTGALVHSFGSMNLSLQFNVPAIQFDDYLLKIPSDSCMIGQLLLSLHHEAADIDIRRLLLGIHEHLE